MSSGYHNKLVFVGDMGAGKTTAVRAISDVEPVSTEMPVSASERMEGKSTTTVALDYSTIELDDGDLLHVYGVPGQKYLDFMWPMVCQGALGIIVLVNAANPNKLANTQLLLREFAQIAPTAHFAIGVTRTDVATQFDLVEFRQQLFRLGHKLPVMKVDARSSEQVEFLIKTLLAYSYVGNQLTSA